MLFFIFILYCSVKGLEFLSFGAFDKRPMGSCDAEIVRVCALDPGVWPKGMETVDILDRWCVIR